jgi:ATP-dependent Lon protease
MGVRGVPADVSELGLFPLPLVLLPTEQVPLHIFEERYQELISECLDTESEFGLVYADDDGIREVGTRAVVAEVLTRFDDGRLNIVVEGGERFRLAELTSGRSFQTGVVAPLLDADDPAEPVSVVRARELFGRLRELTGSDVEVPDATDPQLSYALAARVELGAEVKLELLVEVSERIRLERVCELLEGAAVTVQRRRHAAERAATNGRVDFE